MLSSRLMKKISRKSRTLLHGWFTFSTMMIQKKCLRFVYIYYTLLYIRGAINWILSAIPNSYTQLQIIFRVRKHILTGGPKRLPLTIPPLVFSALKVCLSLCDQLFTLFSNWGKNIKFCLHLEGVVCPSFFFSRGIKFEFLCMYMSSLELIWYTCAVNSKNARWRWKPIWRWHVNTTENSTALNWGQCMYIHLDC